MEYYTVDISPTVKFARNFCGDRRMEGKAALRTIIAKSCAEGSKSVRRIPLSW